MFLGKKTQHTGREVTRAADSWKKYEAEKLQFPSYDRTRLEKPSRYAFDNKRKCYTLQSDADKKTAVIMCAGDLMCEPVMSRSMMVQDSQKFFFEHAFEKIKNVLNTSDLAIANLETTVTPLVPYAHEMHRFDGRFHCNAPVEYLDGLKYAGFDAFVLANNHNADAGVEGIFDSIKNIDQKGFLHTGLFTSEADPRALIVSVNGIKLGILSYTEHINCDLDKKILNELGQSVIVNRYSLPKLNADIAEAKAAGAEFILCYIHFRCKEYSHQVTEHQVEVAKEMANSGVDCIMGSHSHSLQPYDEIITKDGKRVPVIFSLGNFITSDNTSMITRKNVIYRLELKRVHGKVVIADESYIPCRVVEDFGSQGFTVWPTEKEWTDGKERSLLMTAEDEIKAVIGSKIRMYHNRPTVLDVEEDSAENDCWNPPDGPRQFQRPQISINEVCQVLNISKPNMSEEELSKKRHLAIVKACIKEGGIALLNWEQDSNGNWVPAGTLSSSEYINTEIARSKGAAFAISAVRERVEGVPTSFLPEGMTARKAWEELCRYIKKKYHPWTITVTGNAGKTTTKDMVSVALSCEEKTLYVRKNFNTWRTAGETILNLDNSFINYVQECHEPHTQDISYMMDADACLITNIGKAHLDEVGNSLDKSKEETLKILTHLKSGSILFLNNDCPILHDLDFPEYRVVRYGTTAEECDYYADNIETDGLSMTFTVHGKDGASEAGVLHMAGVHNVNNAVAAYAVGREKGINGKEIMEALSAYRPDGLRQNLLNAKGCTVLVDCYSSTVISSVKAAETLCGLPVAPRRKRIMVLGYIPALGIGSEEAHKEVGEKLSKLSIDTLICYRKDSRIIADVCKNAGMETHYFEYHKELIQWLNKNVKAGDAVLFKSGTAAHLEQVVNAVFGTKIVPENSMESDRMQNGGDF